MAKAQNDRKENDYQDRALHTDEPFAQGARLGAPYGKELGAPAPCLFEPLSLVAHIRADPSGLSDGKTDQLPIRHLAAALNLRALTQCLRQPDQVPRERSSEVDDLSGLAKQDENNHLEKGEKNELRNEPEKADCRCVLHHRTQPVAPNVVTRRGEGRTPLAGGQSDRMTSPRARLNADRV